MVHILSYFWNTASPLRTENVIAFRLCQPAYFLFSHCTKRRSLSRQLRAWQLRMWPALSPSVCPCGWWSNQFLRSESRDQRCMCGLYFNPWPGLLFHGENQRLWREILLSPLYPPSPCLWWRWKQSFSNTPQAVLWPQLLGSHDSFSFNCSLTPICFQPVFEHPVALAVTFQKCSRTIPLVIQMLLYSPIHRYIVHTASIYTFNNQGSAVIERMYSWAGLSLNSAFAMWPLSILTSSSVGCSNNSTHFIILLWLLKWY